MNAVRHPLEPDIPKRCQVVITRMLIDLVGADRIVCGTDYPQGMGVMKPVEYVDPTKFME